MANARPGQIPYYIYWATIAVAIYEKYEELQWGMEGIIISVYDTPDLLSNYPVGRNY